MNSTDANEIDPTIANKVLEMAQEWGEHWLRPTQPRAAKLYPSLTPAQLDEYDRMARDAMSIGHAVLRGSPYGAIDGCEQAVRAKFPWVNDQNLKRIYSQGQYYADK